MNKEKTLTQKDIQKILENFKTEKYSVKDIEHLFCFLQDVFQKSFEDIVHINFKNFSRERFISLHPEYKTLLTDNSLWMCVYYLRNKRMDLDFFAKVSMDEENKTIIKFFEKLEDSIQNNRIPFGVVKE